MAAACKSVMLAKVNFVELFAAFRSWKGKLTSRIVLWRTLVIIVIFNSLSYWSCVMPHYRCCVGGCDNDSRYPEKVLKRGHVPGDLTWHYFPKDLKERAIKRELPISLLPLIDDIVTVCSSLSNLNEPLSLWTDVSPIASTTNVELFFLKRV